jgi:imidazolonepropionase-like amidohydrolase
VPQITIIKAGFLIDPASGTSSRNQFIRVEAGTITAVASSVQIPSDATVVDLSAYSVLPGIFDAHTHLCLTSDRRRDGNNFANAIYRESAAYRALEDTDLRHAIEAGLVEGLGS